jgi:hypothetical protein
VSTFTYNDALASDLDRIRSQLGITDVSGLAETALISDEHILAALLDRGGVGGAIVFLARELAATFAQLPTSIKSGEDALAWAARVSTWLTLASLAETAAAASASPASGLLTTTAPVSPPYVGGPDGNDRAYRGDVYRGRRRP